MAQTFSKHYFQMMATINKTTKFTTCHFDNIFINTQKISKINQNYKKFKNEKQIDIKLTVIQYIQPISKKYTD